jgi:hypothetical protein
LFSNFEVENWQVLPKEKEAQLAKFRLKRKITLSNFFSKEFARVHKFAPQKKHSLPKFSYRHITPVHS